MDANARIERDWGLATTHTIVWPAGSLDAERLASACAEIAASSREGSYVAGRVAAAAAAEGTTSWRFLDRHRDRFVTTAPCRSLDEFVADLARRERDALLPFAFVVCPGGFALVHSHELGDGSVSAALLEALLCAYADDRAVRRVPDVVARDRDLARALGSLWWRHPAAALDAGAGVVRRLRSRPAPVTVAAAIDGGVRHEHWAVAPSDVAALDAWRRTHPSRPSMSLALLRTVGRALAEHGHPAVPQPWQVVVGMRGGAPALAGFGGNLVGRALVDVDPYGDPAPAVGHLRRQTASGEIVAMHLAKTGVRRAADVAGRLRRPGPGAGPAAGTAAVRVGASPGLSWSDRGRHAYSDALVAAVPTIAPDGKPVRPYVYTVVTPGTSGIGVNVNWIEDRPGVLISFGASPLDDDAVDGVMRTLRAGVGPAVERDVAAA